MKYKMLVSDLDNTLLNSQSQISPGVKKAAAYARGKGVHIVLSSGRCYIPMLAFEKALGLVSDKQAGVSFNGGLVYESISRKVLSEYRLDRELAITLADRLQSQGASVMLYQGGNLYAKKETPDVTAYQRGAFIPVEILSDFRQLSGDISKVLVRGEKPFIECLELSLRDWVSGRCNTFFSSDNLLEYCPLQANKGAGLMKVCEYLGVSPEETIAVGDYGNDISMLRVAGLGVAVANATEETKAAADYVSDKTNDQDAVAGIIYSIIT